MPDGDLPELGPRPLSAFEERLKTWLAGVDRRFDAKLAANDTLELVMLDVIGEDWWTGGGITSKRVQEKLAANPKATTVRVLLNSGGDAFEGLAIQSLLRRHGARIEIEVVGLAASAASIIAMAGDSISMHEGSLMMVHEPWTCTCGDATEMRTAAEFLDKVNSSALDVYERRTGRARSEIAALLAAETWMTAHEAVKEKFATTVVAGAAPIADPEVKARAAARVFMSARPAPKQAAPSPAPTQQEPPKPTPPAGGKQPGAAGTETPSMDLKVLAKLLGLPETATEAEVTAELNKRLTAQAAPVSVTVSGVQLLGVATEAEATAKIQEFQRGILQFLGATQKATVAEALGIMLDWKTKADTADGLTKQLASATEESRVAKRDAAIEKMSREGTLPPARHEWARAQFQTAEAVLSFCEGMPKGFFNSITTPNNLEASTQLTATEKEVCKQLGMSEETFLAEKKIQNSARPSAQAGA